MQHHRRCQLHPQPDEHELRHQAVSFPYSTRSRIFPRGRVFLLPTMLEKPFLYIPPNFFVSSYNSIDREFHAWYSSNWYYYLFCHTFYVVFLRHSSMKARKSMKKRFVSLLVALSITLTFLPMGAVAATRILKKTSNIQSTPMDNRLQFPVHQESLHNLPLRAQFQTRTRTIL